MNQQSEWLEGHRLAASIQFRFPECQKVEFRTVVLRASETGLQLLIDFLLWESEKRPTAQQALKYPFFHLTKRGSDPIHLPTSLLTKHQQQQQIQNNIRNQNIANDRMSHISLDDSERYSSNDESFITRHYSHLNGHPHYQQQHQQSNNIHQKNGFKQAMANSDAKDDDYLADEAVDSMKRTKFENGINSNLMNGELKHYASSMNNNYQSEISAQDANSELSMQPPNTFASVMSDTSLSSTIIIQTRHQQPNGHINYNNHDINSTIAAINGTKGLINNNHHHSKMTEHRKDPVPISGFNNSRRNSRINDENSAFLNEKISDIFVNRNPGKLYNNYNAPGSIFNNKLYNGTESVNQTSATRKGFFLHDNNAAMMNDESKVYNIFSKQRQTKPIKHNTNGDSSSQEENGYLLMKMPNVQAKKPSIRRKSIASTMHEQDSFEDVELDKLLG